MIAALRSELLKLTTTRLWWVLALILVGYVGFTAALLAGLFGARGDQLAAQPDAPQLPPGMIAPVVYSTVTAVGYVFPLILGTLAITSEVRYQTLTPTFLAQPRRGRVLAAKLAVLAVAGAVLGVIGLVVSMGLGAPILAATGTETGLGESGTWALAGRIVLAMALWAVIGVGVGSLIQNQVAAIVVVLAFTQFVEPILRFGTSISDWTASVGRFLPGAASDALVGSSVFTAFVAGGGGVDPLEWWQGGLVLAAIAAVVSVLGYLTAWRRDIT
jgi:ABC-type transport system involved in multi-copper enzyme maturation permease subunit